MYELFVSLLKAKDGHLFPLSNLEDCIFNTPVNVLLSVLNSWFRGLCHLLKALLRQS